MREATVRSGSRAFGASSSSALLLIRAELEERERGNEPIFAWTLHSAERSLLALLDGGASWNR
jgi:hypothetical protein